MCIMHSSVVVFAAWEDEKCSRKCLRFFAKEAVKISLNKSWESWTTNKQELQFIPIFKRFSHSFGSKSSRLLRENATQYPRLGESCSRRREKKIAFIRDGKKRNFDDGCKRRTADTTQDRRVLVEYLSGAKEYCSNAREPFALLPP